MFKKVRRFLYNLCDGLCIVAGYCDISDSRS